MIVFATRFRGPKVGTMCCPLKFLFLILAIEQHRTVDCYAPGSLIWSRDLQQFIPVANVSTFGAYEQEVVARSREEEEHNFEGEVLSLGYFEDYTMVHFVDNDTKVSGVCGEIWNTLADHSNFTLAVIKVDKFRAFKKDDNVTALGMISANEIQIIPRIAFSSAYSDKLKFTTPIWETRYRIYIQSARKFDTNWIFNIFEHKVWFAVLLLYFSLSALGYAMEKISIKVFDDEKRRHNLHDHLFYTFATLCSQGFIPDTLDRRSKILGLSKRMFSWVLLIVLSSHVISHMTHVKKLQPPFENLKSLLNNTDYSVIAYNGSIAFDHYVDLVNYIAKQDVYWSRFTYALSDDEMYTYGCSDENDFAIFELEDMKETAGDGYCELVAVGKSYIPTWVTFGVSNQFKYKRTLDIGIIKMREFGLIDRIKNRWLKTPSKTYSKSSGSSAFVPVNFHKVFIIFAILSIGIVASAAIFVLEVIYFVYKHNQPRPIRRNILIGRGGLNAHRLTTTDYYKQKRMRREIGRLGVV